MFVAMIISCCLTESTNALAPSSRKKTWTQAPVEIHVTWTLDFPPLGTATCQTYPSQMSIFWGKAQTLLATQLILTKTPLMS